MAGPALTGIILGFLKESDLGDGITLCVITKKLECKTRASVLQSRPLSDRPSTHSGGTHLGQLHPRQSPSPER